MSVAATIAPSSPYKGLAAFDDTELDALLFFGRTRETEVVAANVLASRLTVLYGPSGVGKSSLLRAGVVRALRRDGGFPPPAVAVYGSWAGDPLAGLEEAARAAVAEALGREPSNAPGSLTDRLAAWSAELGAEVCLLLDQLEELFLYHPAAEGAGGFVDLLPDLVTRPGLHVNVLLGIRDDALAQLDVFKGRIPGLFANSLRLDHLDREAARAAILGPLDRYNQISEDAVEIEPALVGTVLDEVETGKIEPASTGRSGVESERVPSGLVETPYLQLVMQRVWEVESERGSNVLRRETFHGLGGAQRIVEDHLERALQALTPVERDAAASVFGHLVTPSGTKVAHGVSDLASYAAMPEGVLEPVLRSLARERILRPLGENGHAAGDRYEIFHDVLGDAVLAWRAEHDTTQRLDRERRDAERRHRRMLIFVVAALAALGVMTAVAVFALAQREYALDQRSEARAQRLLARDQARHAKARQLAATSIVNLESNPARSLELALAGARLDPAVEQVEVLRRALLESRLRAALPSRGPVRAVEYSRDGRLVLTASADGTARIFEPRTGRQVRVLRHGAPVDAAAIDPTGRMVATGGRDGRVRLWTVGGKRLRTLRHERRVRDVEFSNDGERLLTASDDHTARIWDVSTGRELRSLEHPGPLRSASFDWTSGRVLTVASDRYARVFDAASGLPIIALPHPARVKDAVFSPTGGFIATIATDRRGRIWHTDLVEMWKELKGHSGQILDVAFSPKGTLVATAGTDGTARVWSVATAKETTLFGHTDHVLHVAFSADGRTLVTAGRDHTARVWQARTGRPLGVLAGNRDSVTRATFSPSGGTVITASDDGVARIWDPHTEPNSHRVSRYDDRVTGLAVAGRERLVVSASADGTAKVASLAGRPIAGVKQKAPVRALAVDARGRIAATAGGRGVAVWRIADGRSVASFPHHRAVRSVAVSRDGTLVATGASDGIVRLWDVRHDRLLRAHRGHSGAVVAVAFSRDGRLIVSAGGDGRARVWEVSNGSLLQVLGRGRAALTGASFSPDGSRVLTTGLDPRARLWRVKNGLLISELRGHKDAVTSGVFSHDGSLVVTASLDHDARLWNGRTGAAIRAFDGHFAGVRNARFSPNARWVVTAGPESAGLWQVSTGRLVLRLRGHGAPLSDAAFADDGRFIVTASDDGDARSYDCRVCGDLSDLIALAERRLARIRR